MDFGLLEGAVGREVIVVYDAAEGDGALDRKRSDTAFGAPGGEPGKVTFGVELLGPGHVGTRAKYCGDLGGAGPTGSWSKALGTEDVEDLPDDAPFRKCDEGDVAGRVVAAGGTPEADARRRDYHVDRQAIAKAAVHFMSERVGEVEVLTAEGVDLLRRAHRAAVLFGVSLPLAVALESFLGDRRDFGGEGDGLDDGELRRCFAKKREKEIRPRDEEAIAAGQRRELGSRPGLGLRTSLRLARTWLSRLGDG